MNYQVLDFCNEDGSINTLNNENVPQGWNKRSVVWAAIACSYTNLAIFVTKAT